MTDKLKFTEQDVDEVAAIIDQLKDERFGNDMQRKKFAQQLIILANKKDQRIRKLFKHLGNSMTDYEYETKPKEESGDKTMDTNGRNDKAHQDSSYTANKENDNKKPVKESTALERIGKRLLRQYTVEWNYRIPYVAVESNRTGETVFFSQDQDYHYTLEGMGGEDYEGNDAVLLGYLDSAGAI
jgi:hypothetical protein